MVNPMLWTLVPGLLLSLGVPLLGRAPARLRSAAAASCAVAFAAAALVLAGAELQPPVLLLRINLLDMLTEAPFFLFGAALAWFEQQAGERLWRADLALLCFAANWVVASWLGGWDIVLEWVTLPYMAACFGRSSVPGLAWLRPLGNPSFGMFLFGFPLQQLIVEYWPADPHPILTCIGLAVPIGLLSWHLVERPALLRGLAAWRRGGLASLRIVF
jgi:peptidoglycan/LPS O-acetylase OafA/YrhL